MGKVHIFTHKRNFVLPRYEKNIVYDRNQRNKADFSTLNFCLGDFGLKKGPKWDQI